jgi:universal stress protein A
MFNIDRVLCPLDFSEMSSVAYDYAQTFARHFRSPLYLEHVIEPFSSVYNYYPLFESWEDVRVREARKHLERFIALHGHGVPALQTAVHQGPAPESILKFAAAKSVNLIVMGTHEHSGAMGSVTEKVMRKSRCPVLVVRITGSGLSARGAETKDIRLRKIVFCTDFSQASNQGLAYALSLAAEFGAGLTLVHVLEGAPAGSTLEKASDAAAQRILALIPPEAATCRSIRTAIRAGKPHEQIIQLTAQEQADLVVMGVRGRSALNLVVFGSTTHQVIQSGTCPVLAVQANSQPWTRRTVSAEKGDLVMSGFSRAELRKALQAELEFLKQGGYRQPSQNPRWATSIFLDSPTCINRGDPRRTHSCKECPLAEFVPPEGWETAFPCHHIPLTPAGDTLNSMEPRGDQKEPGEMVEGWLQVKIREIDSQLSESSRRPAG